jgi:hypothetical protein
MQLSTSPCVSRLSRKCGSLDISQPYGAPRPVNGITLLLYDISLCLLLFSSVMRMDASRRSRWESSESTRIHGLTSHKRILLDFDRFCRDSEWRSTERLRRDTPYYVTDSTQKCPSEKESAFNPIISDLVATSIVALMLCIVSIMTRWSACTCWQLLLFAALWLEISSSGLLARFHICCLLCPPYM